MSKARKTTEELVEHVWDNLREREHVRGRVDELPDKCPPNARMILEAADEIAQWRADEAVRARDVNRRRSKKQ